MCRSKEHSRQYRISVTELTNVDQESVFQIRSSWTQFLMSQRFLRVDDSITCVFSMNLHSPIPSAGTKFHFQLRFTDYCSEEGPAPQISTGPARQITDKLKTAR